MYQGEDVLDANLARPEFLPALRRFLGLFSASHEQRLAILILDSDKAVWCGMANVTAETSRSRSIFLICPNYVLYLTIS